MSNQYQKEKVVLNKLKRKLEQVIVQDRNTPPCEELYLEEKIEEAKQQFIEDLYKFYIPLNLHQYGMGVKCRPSHLYPAPSKIFLDFDWLITEIKHIYF